VNSLPRNVGGSEMARVSQTRHTTNSVKAQMAISSIFILFFLSLFAHFYTVCLYDE